MSATYTVTFNSTYKTLTINVSDLGGFASVDMYISDVGGSTYTIYETAAGLGDTDFTYSGGIQQSSTEDTIFPDGLYSIKVVEIGEATTTEDPTYIIAVGETACCLIARTGNLGSGNFTDCIRDRKIEDILFMKLLLEGVEYHASASCANYTKAAAKLDYIIEWCASDTTDCYKKNCT